MANKRRFVGLVLGIVESTPALADAATAMQPEVSVLFDDGTRARALVGAAQLEWLADLQRHNAPVCVEADEHGFIERVLPTLRVKVVDVAEVASGIHEVGLEISAARHFLRADEPDSQRMLHVLTEAQRDGATVYVTETIDPRWIIEVRKAPSTPAPVRADIVPPLSPEFDFGVAVREIIELDEADNLFAAFAREVCGVSPVGTTCIAFNYPDDFCYARAHKMCVLAATQGIRFRKRWARGPLRANTANSPVCFVEWRWHGAPTVRVGSASSSEWRVFDPSLFTQHVTIDAWQSAIAHGGAEFFCTSPAIYSVFPGIQAVSGAGPVETDLALARCALNARIAKAGSPPPYENCPLEHLSDGAAAATGQANITELLGRCRDGDERARSLLASAIYAQLHRIAERQMRNERRGHTLQPTVLVNQACLELLTHIGQVQNRAHLFALAAQQMRRILIDYARANRARKRGGDMHRIELGHELADANSHPDRLLMLNDALDRLGKIDERQGSVVEMKIFAGLTEEEIASVLGVTSRTVKRDWRVAKAWLRGELSQ